MPVSSLSESLSTGVYFVSLFLLLAVLVPPVSGAYEDSELAAAKHLAAGIAGQVDTLSPGMTSEIEYSSFPGVSESVSLSGRNVTAHVGDRSAGMEVEWMLPTCSLSPGRSYLVSLNGSEVQLA